MTHKSLQYRANKTKSYTNNKNNNNERKKKSIRTRYSKQPNE